MPDRVCVIHNERGWLLGEPSVEKVIEPDGTRYPVHRCVVRSHNFMGVAFTSYYKKGDDWYAANSIGHKTLATVRKVGLRQRQRLGLT